MDEREFEQMLGQVMKHDFSAGSEAFRDALLERCLGELASDEDGMPLEEDDLDMLSAAGDLFVPGPGEPGWPF